MDLDGILFFDPQPCALPSKLRPVSTSWTSPAEAPGTERGSWSPESPNHPHGEEEMVRDLKLAFNDIATAKEKDSPSIYVAL